MIYADRRAPRITTAIDPGVHKNAIAEFVDSELVHFSFDAPTVQPHVVVLEQPQADARTETVDLRTILALTASGNLLAGRLLGRTGGGFESLTPTEWKGSEPKPLNHARLWAVLSEEERDLLGGDKTLARIEKAVDKGALRRWKIKGADCYPRSWDFHNILDAVALGCTYLGRLRKRG